ncbi:DNA integrity scanning protein DisA [Candidatus Pacearchaeota archaeon]|nr:DNA integrity scanning protein DisA [Candidatus Pacearchaeota archaeon]
MTEVKDKEVKELVISETKIAEKKDFEKDFLEVLKMISPGTSIRSALDDLLNAEMGALIVYENDFTPNVTEKGFRINARFSSQRLVELAKMDGAIILSKDGKKILHANALLFPSVEIPTKETGTRHKAAERTSKQTKALVIAVSERKNKITVYLGDVKYELKESSEILRRASETLQVLEKQREIYDYLLTNLNILEMGGLVAVNDVCNVIQRLEIIKRISGIVRRYLIELGKEGIIISMRLKELIGNLSKDEEIILRDYFSSKYLSAMDMLEKMNFDFLLESGNISRLLFEELYDKPISPQGIRLLGKTKIPERHVNELIVKFSNLNEILSARNDDLIAIFEKQETIEFFNKEINRLRERVLMGKDMR